MDYVYVDNSNLYIEGRRVSAVKQGLAKDIKEAMNNGIFDHGYQISFGKLHARRPKCAGGPYCYEAADLQRS